MQQSSISSKRYNLFMVLSLTACGQHANTPIDVPTYGSIQTVRWNATSSTAVTSDNGSDTVSLVATDTGRLIGTFPIGLDPLANDGPHHLVIDPVRRLLITAFAYPPPTASVGPHGNHGASTQLGIVASFSLDTLRPVAQASVESNPGDILLSPDGTKVMVTHFELSRVLSVDGAVPQSAVTVHELPSLTRVGFARPCLATHGAAFSPDGRWGYVTCNGEDSLAVLDMREAGLAPRLFAVGPGPGRLPILQYGPYSVTMTRDGANGYVGTLEGRSVREFTVNPADGSVRFDNARTVRVGGAAFFAALSIDETALFVPTQNPDQLLRVDRATMSISMVRSFTADECKLPHQVLRSPENNYFIVCEGLHTLNRSTPGTVLQFDPQTLSTRSKTEVGIYPDAIAFLPRQAQ